MIYSFYDPSHEARAGLGNFIILDHIRRADADRLPYVYLGYWVPGSQKMGYKAKFSGLEVYLGGTWQKMTDPESFEPEQSPLGNDPIAEQVANIALPDMARSRRK